jgi:hypothetical protein
LLEQAGSLLNFAQGRSITGESDVKAATEDLSILARLKKALKARQTEYTKPVKDHLDNINQAFAAVTVPLEQANKITREKILKYNADQEKRRLEIEDINRKKEELAKREAALNEGEITVNTTPIPVPAAPPKRVHTDVGTLGTSLIWKLEITDASLIPREYLQPDMVKIRKVVEAKVTIPGIRSWQEPSLRVNTK